MRTFIHLADDQEQERAILLSRSSKRLTSCRRLQPAEHLTTSFCRHFDVFMDHPFCSIMLKHELF